MSVRHRHWLALGLLVFGAAAWSAAPGLLGLQGTVGLVFGAGSAALLELIGVLRQRHVRRRNLRSILAAIHTDMDRLDPVADLGLRPSAVARQKVRPHARPAGRALPPYIPGAVDGALDRAFLDSNFVLVTGNSLAGRSRSAFEAIRRVDPGPVLMVPENPDSLRRLLELDPPLLDTWRTVFIWLGDFRRFIGGPESDWDPALAGTVDLGLSNALFTRHLRGERRRFLGRRPRVVFVATLTARDYDLYTAGYEALLEEGAANPLTRLLRLADRVHLGEGKEAGWDLERAHRLYRGVDFSQGVGRAFSEAELLVNAYRSGLDEASRALVRATVDWHRIGAGTPDDSDIRALLSSGPEVVVDERALASARRDAGLQVGSGQKLWTVLDQDGERRYRAHPYLVDADEGYGVDGIRREIPAHVWDVATEQLSAAELSEVARAAEARRARDAADRIWDFVISSEDVKAETRARAHLDRGESRLADDPSQAEADFTAAIEMPGLSEETRAFAYKARGAALMQQGGREAEAERDCSAAMALPGASAQTVARARANRGGIRMNSNRPDEAEPDLNAVIDDPTAEDQPHCFAYAHRGLLRFDQGRQEEAVADFTAAIACTGAHPETRASAYVHRGVAVSDLQGFRQAEEDFTCAIELRGAAPETVAGAYLRRAISKRDRGLLGEAEADATAAIEADGVAPKDRAYAYIFRGRLRKKTRPAAVASDLTAAIEIPGLRDEVYADAYLARGEIRGLEEKWSAAENDFAKALERAAADPSRQANIALNRGVMRCRKGEPAKGESDFSIAIENPGSDPPTRARALVNRGLLRAEAKRPRAAERDLRAALEIPDAAATDALEALADLLRSLGRADEEIALYGALAEGGREDLAPIAAARLAVNARRTGSGWLRRFVIRRRR